MELDMGNATAAAARAARTTLSHLAGGSQAGAGVDEPRMAKIAQAAIFEEALLGALHARLSEIRSVAK
jgi:hypothetical protein